MTQKAQTTPTPWAWLLPIALVPALLAVLQLGRLHPDELYQVLEPGYAELFPYARPSLAWEWTAGLRNKAAVLLVAALLKLSLALGLTSPRAWRAVLEVPQLLLHLAMLAAVFRLTARRLHDGRLALAAVGLVGLYGPLLHFAGRTLGEAYSTALLVLALERLELREGRARTAAWGGALLGLAVVARYGSAVVVLAAMGWLLVQRRVRHCAAAAAGGLAVAAALGALDFYTWGAPFHSLRQYVDFNLVSGRAAAQFGADPAWFYLPLLGWAPLWVWPGLWRWLRESAVRAPFFLVPGLAYFAVVSATAHKEARFLYPALVLLTVGAAPGALSLLAGLRSPVRVRAALALALAASLVLFAPPAPAGVTLPFAVQRPEQFRLQAKAAADATGFILVNEGFWGAGGFFWLGKEIPWFTCDFAEDPRFQAAMRDARFNRVVTWDGRALDALAAHGFTVLEVQGQATLLGRTR